jgi:hypothetical protein
VAGAEGLALVFTLTLLAALLPVIGVTGAAIASTVPHGVSLAIMLRALPDGLLRQFVEMPAKRRSAICIPATINTDTQEKARIP